MLKHDNHTMSSHEHGVSNSPGKEHGHFKTVCHGCHRRYHDLTTVIMANTMIECYGDHDQYYSVIQTIIIQPILLQYPHDRPLLVKRELICPYKLKMRYLRILKITPCYLCMKLVFK